MRGQASTTDILLMIRKKYLLIFLASSILGAILYAFLNGAWTIPVLNIGIVRMSPLDAGDYSFIGAAALLLALFITLWWIEHDHYKETRTGGGSTSGTIAGILAGACPYCHAIGITALGSTLLSIPIGPIVPYLGVLKIVSLGAMLLVIVLKVQSIRNQSCTICDPHAGKKARRTLVAGIICLLLLLAAGVIVVQIRGNPIPYEPLPPDLVVRQYLEGLGRGDYRDAYNTFSDGFKVVQPSAATLIAYQEYAAALHIASINVTDLQTLSHEQRVAKVSYHAAITFQNGTQEERNGTYILKYRMDDLIEGWKLLQPYGAISDKT